MSALLVFLRYPALARRSLRSFLSLRSFAPRTRGVLFCRCALLLCPDAVHPRFFPVFARLASPLFQPSLPQAGHGEKKQDEHDDGSDDDRYDGAGTHLVLLPPRLRPEHNAFFLHRPINPIVAIVVAAVVLCCSDWWFPPGITADVP